MAGYQDALAALDELVERLPHPKKAALFAIAGYGLRPLYDAFHAETG